MATPPDYLSLEFLEALLADALPAEQRERYVRHLETCPLCQERLDRAEEHEDALVRLARQVGDPSVTLADPTLTQVLERLHEELATPQREHGDMGMMLFTCSD